MGIKKILVFLISWRIGLQILLLFSIFILPLQFNFLGGELSNYLHKPYMWAWSNFDGEHYIYVARFGYTTLTHFYFPFFPSLIHLIAKPLGNTFYDYLISGLLISHASFLIGVIGLIRVIRLDYEKKIATLTLIILLLFPVSFYFASVYTESLFFALVVWSFYFARTKNWFLAGILGGFATATRIIGLALFPALLIEYFWQRKGKIGEIGVIGLIRDIGKICITLIGFLVYSYFLYTKTGDPLEFLHTVDIFGAQRSTHLILLPQVFYRYFVNILPNLNYNYFQGVFATYLELGSAIVFGGLGILGGLGWLGKYGRLKENKMRLSYLTFLIIAYMLPTFSGSFSSFPRYTLVLFPAFILAGNLIGKRSRLFQFVIFVILFVLLTISTMLFSRGYWIS